METRYVKSHLVCLAGEERALCIRFHDKYTDAVIGANRDGEPGCMTAGSNCK